MEWSHVASVHGSSCPHAPGLEEEEGGGGRGWKGEEGRRGAKVGGRGAPWLPHRWEEEASDGQFSEGGAPAGGYFRYIPHHGRHNHTAKSHHGTHKFHH